MPLNVFMMFNLNMLNRILDAIATNTKVVNLI